MVVSRGEKSHSRRAEAEQGPSPGPPVLSATHHLLGPGVDLRSLPPADTPLTWEGQMWEIQRPVQRAPHESTEGGQASTLVGPGRWVPEGSAMSGEHTQGTGTRQSGLWGQVT